MEGLESSPGCGWVTSAPNIMVGLSLTRGILLVKASTSTVFLPPTWKGRKTVRKLTIQEWLKDGSVERFYLNIYFECNICKILLAHLKNMFSQTTLRDQSKISLTDPFEIPWEMKRMLMNKCIQQTMFKCVLEENITIKRTIIVRQYYNQQVKFSALRPEYVHGILIASL